MSDIEKGGTFDSRKRVPKIISNELRDKIKDHKSNSSEGEYHFNTTKYKKLINEQGVNKTSAFGTPLQESQDGQPQQPSVHAFKTQVQSGHSLSFAPSRSQNMSDFGNRRDQFDQFHTPTSKAMMSKINIIVKKAEKNSSKNTVD